MKPEDSDETGKMIEEERSETGRVRRFKKNKFSRRCQPNRTMEVHFPK